MKGKNKHWMIIGGIILVLILIMKSDFSFTGAITGSETIARTAPTKVDSGSSFQVTYTASGVSGAWGASIEDSVSGGCTFPSGSTTYKTVMLSEDGNTKTITMNAPSSGSCVFTGDYKFGTYDTHSMPTTTVNICTSHSTTQCYNGDIYYYDSCGDREEAQTTCQYNSCMVISSSPKCCSTDYDSDCNDAVSRTELGVAINAWVGNTLDRDTLGTVITLWVASA